MKRNTCLAATATFIIVAASFGAWAWAYWTPAGTVVSGRGYTGLILTDKSHFDWIPSRKDVGLMEKDFAHYLPTDKSIQGTRLALEPTRFWRHYAGISRDGRRMIAMTFLHRTQVSRRAWMSGTIVMGGGDYYWDIVYDPATQTFTQPHPNAPM